MKEFNFEKVSIQEVVNDLKDKPLNALDLNWKTLRGTPPATQKVRIDTATRTWLGDMPKEIRPNWLVKQYPRIADRLAEFWTRPAACRQYLDELTFDQRGGRQGFSPAVALELATLKDFLDRLKTEKRGDVWDDDYSR